MAVLYAVKLTDKFDTYFQGFFVKQNNGGYMRKVILT